MITESYKKAHALHSKYDTLSENRIITCREGWRRSKSWQKAESQFSSTDKISFYMLVFFIY